MKQVFLNTYVIAKKIFESMNYLVDGKITSVEHTYYCRAISDFAGEDAFKEAFDMAKRMLSGEKVFRSSKPRAFEARYTDDGTTYRKMFDSIEKAEKFLEPYCDVEIIEHLIE